MVGVTWHYFPFTQLYTFRVWFHGPSTIFDINGLPSLFLPFTPVYFLFLPVPSPSYFHCSFGSWLLLFPPVFSRYSISPETLKIPCIGLHWKNRETVKENQYVCCVTVTRRKFFTLRDSTDFFHHCRRTDSTSSSFVLLVSRLYVFFTYLHPNNPLFFDLLLLVELMIPLYSFPRISRHILVIVYGYWLSFYFSIVRVIFIFDSVVLYIDYFIRLGNTFVYILQWFPVLLLDLFTSSSGTNVYTSKFYSSCSLRGFN